MKSWAAVSRKTSTSIKLREVQDRNGFQENGRLKRQSERAVSSNAVLARSVSYFKMEGNIFGVCTDRTIIRCSFLCLLSILNYRTFKM